MPLRNTARGSIFYRLDGPDAAPVVVLAHSLGQDHTMWDRQADDLAVTYRVLRFDLRGHGASVVTPGDYSIEDLSRDVLALVDALGIDRFAFCGVSIGGMMGQWLGAHAAERLSHLVLANTSPRVADPAAMETRRQAVLAGGMAAVADAALGRFFSPSFPPRMPAVVAASRRTLLATDPVGYAGCCAAVRDMDQRLLAGAITVPTLVIGGNLDVSMPWADHGQVLAAAVANARTVRLEAAHLSNLERPRAFSAALLEFLRPSVSESTRESGMTVRRAVLGDAHVDRSMAAATDFNRDFQELITTFAWGTIWTRPGLDRRTRRLLVLAITASMGRWEEFGLHLRSGLDHELEPEDVREVLLQTAVYAGVPAANTAFHLAMEEIKKRDAGRSGTAGTSGT
jgi:3-oxoadipate enol-lactonase / 4-carboxymuconolactone decarboxylase